VPDLQFDLRPATVDEIDLLEPLWSALYQHQAEHGMRLRMPEKAYETWVESIKPLLGRFAVVFVAVREGHIVAFVAGRIRALPPYFGSATIGAISEVFVCDAYRGAGLGRRLLALTVEWFQAQQITRIELQVVSGNPRAVHFYQQLGWHEELLQMVWDCAPATKVPDR
jgi:GNAT superfamily N-acetyltransferase